MDTAGDYLRSVVRVFPDYAGTVIWFVTGPLHYDQTVISDELRTAMTRWERAWHAGMNDDLSFRSREISNSLGREGLRLAELLSEQLGDALEVELIAPETDTGTVRMRGVGAGTNPAAVAAFRRILAEEKADHDRIRALVEHESDGRWTVEGADHSEV